VSSDPYVQAQELRQRLEHTAGRLGTVLDRPEALARLSDRDELRELTAAAAAAVLDFEALLDWADESELPSGLRAALDRPGVHELSVSPKTGLAEASGPNPLEAGEPLRALVHTTEMGEAYDRARLDVVDLGLGEGYEPPGRAEHVALPYRFRLRAFAEELDSELGPLEHAALYLDAPGARRLTAVLRRQLVAAQREDDR